MALDPAAFWYLALAALAVVYAALITLQSIEFRRFTRSRLRQVPQPPPGLVALICPCRGNDSGLAANLRRLFEQDHKHYRLVFVVDRLEDPAAGVIRRLMDRHSHVEARLLVAGLAHDSGQKVHNLIVATGALSAEVEYLAFVDSDARAPRSWLRSLVQHLEAPGVVAASAYRWTMPRRASLANCLLHSLDAGVAPLVGPSKHHLVWGGAWAIRRDAFVAAGLRDAWRGTLSDDLVASRQLRGQGHVEFEPGAMVTTAVDHDVRSLLEFVRRQFTIGRYYAPAWWSVGFVLASLHQAVFWIGLALVPWAAVGGLPGWAAAASAGLYLLQVARAWCRQDAARGFAPDLGVASRTARWFDLWLAPLAGLLACCGFASALCGSTIAWRGTQYKLARGGKVAALTASSPAAARRLQTRRRRRSRADIRRN